MALYKRGKTWHTDFSVNGERFRQSLDTTDWREAQSKEKELIKAASDGKLHSARRSLAGEEFNAAVQPYLLERETEIQDWRHEAQLAKPLQRFFDKTRLRDIGAENVRAYQRSRLAEGRHPATVNHEVKLLFRLLRRAKLLHILRDDVKLLSVPKVPRKMLTSEQKLRVFETASARPEWQLAYCAALLTANASLRPVELRRLCWPDIERENRTLTVGNSKTEAGSRVIPLNDEAWSAISALWERAVLSGASEPNHHIFHRLWPQADPERPMGVGGWRSAWRSLRKAAGFPNLRFYDLRHQFVTELCEAGVPEVVIRELAGHIDPAMTRP